MMQIRARDDRALTRLKVKHSLSGEIIETPKADYRWRVLVSPETLSAILMREAESIDYDNFKDACIDDAHEPLMDVWRTMLRHQRKRVLELGKRNEDPYR